MAGLVERGDLLRVARIVSIPALCRPGWRRSCGRAVHSLVHIVGIVLFVPMTRYCSCARTSSARTLTRHAQLPSTSLGLFVFGRRCGQLRRDQRRSVLGGQPLGLCGRGARHVVSLLLYALPCCPGLAGMGLARKSVSMRVCAQPFWSLKWP